MRNLRLSIVLTLSFLSVAQAQNLQTIASAAPEVLDVAYCDLLRNPTSYDGKVVRVRATYRYGFEWSEIYCTGCSVKGSTWLDFDESYESRTKRGVKKKLEGDSFLGRTVNIVAVGKFIGSGGGYGHMNGYNYMLLVQSVERAEVILNDSPVPAAMSNKALQRTRCHADSHQR